MNGTNAGERPRFSADAYAQKVMENQYLGGFHRTSVEEQMVPEELSGAPYKQLILQ